MSAPPGFGAGLFAATAAAAAAAAARVAAVGLLFPVGNALTSMSRLLVVAAAVVVAVVVGVVVVAVFDECWVVGVVLVERGATGAVDVGAEPSRGVGLCCEEKRNEPDSGTAATAAAVVAGVIAVSTRAAGTSVTSAV